MGAKRILVVDDDAKIRMLVRAYLEADGFAVKEAADGTGGLRAALEEKPDLVILDVMMPGLDGFEVLRRLRRRSDVPVILLTARDEEVDRVVGFTAGGDDYVSKPFSARELALRVRAILRRSTVSGDAAATEDVILRSRDC
ncbi:response regulator transcription factor [Actinomadura madurae]|uniref:response regulator transcription factor n=1 Tax=Actinomadura madurae TaxID=1993 RepID=UPI000D85C07F|nr:response regulator [Actinomadura madurae]SPT58016.1 Alkaline phosphatase synthesis transcriptional regulatory protein phoP [Actinomadura madurae]